MHSGAEVITWSVTRAWCYRRDHRRPCWILAWTWPQHIPSYLRILQFRMEKEKNLDGIICEPLDRRSFVEAETKHSKRKASAGRFLLAVALWSVWRIHRFACKTAHVCFYILSFIYWKLIKLSGPDSAHWQDRVVELRRWLWMWPFVVCNLCLTVLIPFLFWLCVEYRLITRIKHTATQTCPLAVCWLKTRPRDLGRYSSIPCVKND